MRLQFLVRRFLCYHPCLYNPFSIIVTLICFLVTFVYSYYDVMNQTTWNVFRHYPVIWTLCELSSLVAIFVAFRVDARGWKKAIEMGAICLQSIVIFFLSYVLNFQVSSTLPYDFPEFYYAALIAIWTLIYLLGWCVCIRKLFQNECIEDENETQLSGEGDEQVDPPWESHHPVSYLEEHFKILIPLRSESELTELRFIMRDWVHCDQAFPMTSECFCDIESSQIDWIEHDNRVETVNSPKKYFVQIDDCQHVFHLECLQKWIISVYRNRTSEDQMATCPCCRGKLSGTARIVEGILCVL